MAGKQDQPENWLITKGIEKLKATSPPSPFTKGSGACKPAFALNGLWRTRGRGEIGRRTRLRIWRREAWGFESLRTQFFDDMVMSDFLPAGRQGLFKFQDLADFKNLPNLFFA